MCVRTGFLMKRKRAHPILRTIFFAFLISALFSTAVMFAANDVFALTKTEKEVTVVIPEGATAEDVSQILGEQNLLQFPFLYRVYARFRDWSDEYLTGEFTLNRAMGYDELRYMLAPKKGVRLQKKITIPEGFTTDEVIALFVAEGIGTEEGFLETIENGGNFGYDFLDAIPKNEGRIHRLDGYLFPDTYFFYSDSTESEVISKLLMNFNRKFDENLRMAAQKRGYTVDEILCLASIIESEAYFRSDMTMISSVFHNRLENRGFPYLQSDATVKYAKEASGNREMLTADDLDILESPYNTYKQKGLPPGAICSPGLDAIMAALEPADTDYYYFVSSADKTTIFSRTYAEHLRAVASLRS